MTERVGGHGDAFWGQEFPLMVAWAFGRSKQYDGSSLPMLLLMARSLLTLTVGGASGPRRRCARTRTPGSHYLLVGRVDLRLGGRRGPPACTFGWARATWLSW